MITNIYNILLWDMRVVYKDVNLNNKDEPNVIVLKFSSIGELMTKMVTEYT